MKTLHFEIHINAPVEKVWHTMLDDSTYREWTNVFSPGSYFIGDWSEGSKISFVGPDEKGQLGGLIGTIAVNRKYEFVSIKYLGVIQNGVENTDSEIMKDWIGATEKYTFKEENNETTVFVELDTTDSEAAYFEETWPKALEKLKEIAER